MYEKSGNVKVFSCNEVDSITFGKVKSDLTVPVTMISSTPISLTLRFDMPKECSKYYVYCATEDHAVAPDSLQKLIVLYHQFELTEGGEETLNNMVYNTEHTIYTLAFDKFGEPGGIASVHAKTTEYPGPLFTFDVSDLTQTSAHIKLTPAIKDMTYTYTLTKKAKYESDLEKNDGDISKFDRA